MVDVDPRAAAEPTGYDPAFLGPEVRAPAPAPAPAPGEVTLAYLHFTVVFAPERKLPRYTVVNIDGKRKVDIGAREDDDWEFDERVVRTDRVGDEFYLHNPIGLDRGHLVRPARPGLGKVTRTRRARCA